MKYPLSLIRYTNKPQMGGEAKFFFIDIKPKYKSDIGLHVHEYWHVLQFYFWWALISAIGVGLFFLTSDPVNLLFVPAGFFTHNGLYNLVPFYQKFCEIQCYKKQIACYPKGHPIDFAVKAMATKYKFKMTEAEARKALS